jgi:hypothetical protein
VNSATELLKRAKDNLVVVATLTPNPRIGNLMHTAISAIEEAEEIQSPKFPAPIPDQSSDT